MIGKEKSADILTRGLAPEILIVLLEKPAHILELREKLGHGSYTTIDQRIKEFLELGLVTEEIVSRFPVRRQIALTAEGRRVAEVAQFMKEFFNFAELSERRKWILSIFDRFEKVSGTTRMEKYLFLLKEDIGAPVGNNFYEFVWHKYGPFSADVARDLHYLELEGLLRSEEEVFRNVKTPEGKDTVVRRTYWLTDMGKDVARKVYEELSPEAKEALRKLKRFHSWRLDEILGYVYNKYAKKFGVEQQKSKTV